MLGKMPKSVWTPEGKEIPVYFSIHDHWLIPKPTYFQKEVWLYDIMGMEQFLQTLVDILKKTQLIEKVTNLGIKAHFKLGRSIKELTLWFKIDEWYDREILDSIITHLQLLFVDAKVEQGATLAYGHFTIRFKYSNINIPFKEVEELFIDGDQK